MASMNKKTTDIKEFLKKFNEEYDFLYDNDNNVCGYDDALKEGDLFISDTKNINFIREFNEYRQDILSSDREVVAFMFTMESMGLL